MNKAANTTTATENLDATLLLIAQEWLNVDTLDEQVSDSADFHDCHVSNISAALRAAYEAGRNSTTGGGR